MRNKSFHNHKTARFPFLFTATSHVEPGPSPASVIAAQSASEDDNMYAEKLKELSVYIEPLKKMIARMTKENRQTETSKLGSLLSILQSSTSEAR